MSSFMETPRFPTNISKGVSFGPEFSTTVSTSFSGYEYRNKNRSRAVCKGDCAHAVKTPAQFKELLTYFRSVGGRFSGFRFKDWSDYLLSETDSTFTLISNTVNQYQTTKVYSSYPGFAEYRPIKKPVTGTYILKSNSAIVTEGIGSGQYSIDYNTGIITLVADQSRAITSHTVGSDHIFTFSGGAFSPAPSIGDYIACTGSTGSNAALVNNILHQIKATPTSSTITVETSTTGTISGGVIALYKQSSLLSASCEFDVPVRFDTDFMPATMEHLDVFTWGQVPIIEILQ